MDWKTLLLSPNGRVNRARYWIAALVSYAVYMVFYVPTIATVDQQAGIGPVHALLMIVVGLFGFVVAYIGIVLGIKRFHDRDKSGWWMLISLIPLVGGIWVLVECGCLRGTVGRNRFGPDPLLPNDDIVDVFGSPSPAGRLDGGIGVRR